jgi:transcriptional regulator with XRE-family HTH domain
MDIRAALSANIRKYRLRKGWSQEELAEESGLHRTYVSGVERGARNPTVQIVGKLAKALGVKAADLFKEPSE